VGVAVTKTVELGFRERVEVEDDVFDKSTMVLCWGSIGTLRLSLTIFKLTQSFLSISVSQSVHQFVGQHGGQSTRQHEHRYAEACHGKD
jgi:hypothetical protein